MVGNPHETLCLVQFVVFTTIIDCLAGFPAHKHFWGPANDERFGTKLFLGRQALAGDGMELYKFQE